MAEFHDQLPLLKGWSIERHMLIPGAHHVELHEFSDASMKAYGACIYLKAVAGIGIKLTLICAKSRVAPIKSVSLPRLELCGVLLLVRLFKMAKDAVRVRIDSARFLCESTIILAWI